MQETEKFALAIAQISNEVKSLSVPDELFGPKAFIEIYENPQRYLPSATALIARRNVSTHQKMIVGFAMQRLPVEQFVGFVSVIADSVEQGVTDIKVLESAAFAPLNWGKQSLIMHYQDPRVHALLMRLMAMKQMSADRKAYIRDHIMNGQAKRDYLDYMDMLGRPVKE